LCARLWRPHPQMVLGKRDSSLLQRLACAVTVEPGWGDEAVDGPTDYTFNERATVVDPRRRFRTRQAEELALASGHETRPDAIGRARILRVVAVREAVQEHLDTLLSP